MLATGARGAQKAGGAALALLFELPRPLEPEEPKRLLQLPAAPSAGATTRLQPALRASAAASTASRGNTRPAYLLLNTEAK